MHITALPSNEALRAKSERRSELEVLREKAEKVHLERLQEGAKKPLPDVLKQAACDQVRRVMGERHYEKFNGRHTRIPGIGKQSKGIDRKKWARPQSFSTSLLMMRQRRLRPAVKD